ncbi:hypothetical protein [Sandarakinorhabdus sp.]|uniref:hypothetical protein n=1 Tax=Sandarakinorhabdus sp. TaxID=1916663 RepID=UPI00334198BE
MASNNSTTALVATAQAVNDTGAPVAITGARKIRVTSAATPRSYLQVAELQAVEAITGKNVALATEGGTAASSGTDYVGTGHDRAIDGVFPGAYPEIYHSGKDDDAQFLEVTFAAPANLASVTIYGRSGMCFDRDCYKITILNDAGQELFSGQLDNRLLEGGGNSLTFAVAASPPPETATVTVRGQTYELVTLVGSFRKHRAKLWFDPWYTDAGLAEELARALQATLGNANRFGSEWNLAPGFANRTTIDLPRQPATYTDNEDYRVNIACWRLSSEEAGRYVQNFSTFVDWTNDCIWVTLKPTA